MNAVDLGVLAVLVISAILAFARGFTHETLAIGGWAAAVFATVFGFEPLKPYAELYVEPTWLAQIVTGAGLFLVTLLIATIVSRAIAKRIQASVLGPVDRSLGFLFGLARGAVILCLAYLLFVQIVPPEDRPDWLMQARTRPLVERGAGLLLDLAPPEVREKTVLAIERAASQANEIAETKKLYDELADPGTDAADGGNDGDLGYKGADRQELERLLETTRQ
jgi:membrane protein required for colicin V production